LFTPPISLHLSLSFYYSLHPRALHSFPTRRSSDLLWRESRIGSIRVKQLQPECQHGIVSIGRGAQLPIGARLAAIAAEAAVSVLDRKSTRLNSSHRTISYAVFCLKKKTETIVNNE